MPTELALLVERIGKDVDFRMYTRRTPSIGTVYLCEFGHVTLEIPSDLDLLAFGRIMERAKSWDGTSGIREEGDSLTYEMEPCKCGRPHLYVTESFTARFDLDRAGFQDLAGCVVKAIDGLGLTLNQAEEKTRQ